MGELEWEIRANFRLGYMEGCVKKNRNLEMVFAGETEKGQVEITSLNPHFPLRELSTRC